MSRKNNKNFKEDQNNKKYDMTPDENIVDTDDLVVRKLKLHGNDLKSVKRKLTTTNDKITDVKHKIDNDIIPIIEDISIEQKNLTDRFKDTLVDQEICELEDIPYLGDTGIIKILIAANIAVSILTLILVLVK